MYLSYFDRSENTNSKFLQNNNNNKVTQDMPWIWSIRKWSTK